MHIENLEPRALFAADPMLGASPVAIRMTNDGDTIRITTLSADNTIYVYPDGTSVRIAITATSIINGQTVTSRQSNIYDCAKIHRVEIDAGAGNDRVEISKKLKCNAIVYAGAGSDTVVTGAGADRIYGGDHLDNLTGGLGNDTIDAGAGDDRITATGGYDQIWGNTGNDRITLATPGHRIDGGTGTDRIALKDAIPDRIDRVEKFDRTVGNLVPVSGNQVHAARFYRIGADQYLLAVRGDENVTFRLKLLSESKDRVVIEATPYAFVLKPGDIPMHYPEWVGDELRLGKLEAGPRRLIIRTGNAVVFDKVLPVGAETPAYYVQPLTM